jgi:predicted extracellular nuclease
MHPSTQRRVLSLLLILTVALSLAPLAAAAPAAPLANDLRISQVYGGGGGSGYYLYDYVELFNAGVSSINISGWSLQYGSAIGQFASPTSNLYAFPTGTTVAAGHYLLVQLGAAGTSGLALPVTPDLVTSNLAMSQANGKVALANIATALGCGATATPCALPHANIVDLAAWGTSNNAEGGVTINNGVGLTNQQGGVRKSDGCQDTDNNGNDFDVLSGAALQPRNASSPANSCGASDLPPTVASTVPTNGATNVALASNITVTFSEPVTVSGAWYSISCATSGAHTATVSGGPATFTLNPDTDFSAGESCTATIYASQVVDQDGTPDHMAADHVFSFTTVAANVCNTAFTPIYGIQGSGSSAAITGAVVTQGVVVGDFEGPSPALRGFYLQDLAGDSDPATSDGIFVFNGDTDSVTLGDVVRVTGSAEEFQNQTQISSVSSILPCGVGSVTPVDVSLPFSAADYPERYEGMLVRLPQTLYVTEHFQLGRFGQAVLTSRPDRLQQPTNVTTPGAAALALQAANNLDRIILDDQTNSQNPDPIAFGRGALPLSASNTLRGGDSAAGIVGVLTYTWSGNAASGNAYRLRPIGALNGGAINFAAANPRPASPTVGGRLRVTAANLLNYFNSFGNGNCQLGVGGGATNCRGANDAAEFARQWPKTVANLVNGGADVIGIMEIENDGYGASSAIQDLVNQLNSATAAGTYAFIDADALTSQTNALGVDAIKVGLIYKPGKVTPVGTTAALNTTAFVNGGDSAARNRPALAQAFQEISSGERFIVVVNHLKSKGSACNAPDAGDGQGNCNGVRTAAATLMTAWLAGNPTGTGDPDIMIMGDLNSYAQEDPITAIKSAGYVNLIESRLGVSAYSYAFDGQWGYLDHALATAALDAQVVGAQEWHINADEPSVLDYNTEFKTPGQITSLYAADQFRSSDHDPVIIGLNLRNPLAVTLAGFEAQGLGDRIVVSWETVSEIDNAGFNLYRTGAFAEQPEQDDLLAYLPSQGPGSTQGFAYRYEDLTVQPGESWWYWLEDVSLSGVTTLHGPVSATASAPTAVRLSSVSATPAAAGSALLPWLLAAGGAGALLALGRRRR